VNISGGMRDLENSGFTTVAGSPVGSNQYLLDGVPITDLVNRPTFAPSADAIAEMKVHVSTYDAEAGRTGGGVWNSLIKSGTNSLHGTVYGSSQPARLRANSWFNNRNNLPRVSNPNANYAETIGGPVYIPRVYKRQEQNVFLFLA
jgi:trimeric autotransporter adhesin